MVDYHGYDYLGNKNTSAVNFADYWTARDENGQLTRPMDAFRPVYMAGYLQDKFAFKDLIFNVGVRVDRFDANQKVLKDKYSLYGIKSVSEATDFQHPAAVGADWAVYVNDPTNPTQVEGYRNGDEWYNENGELITDFTLVDDNQVPYLNIGNIDNPANYIKDDNFDVNSSFEDYTPQISVMPRVSFSFPISQDALFFAHYNVLSQRPQGRIIASASDYFYLPNEGFVNNSNLKPERTIDYQLGYKQKLSRSSALSLSAFYRELKDMAQYTNIFNAYPIQYNTFANVDFGTVKGLETTYDLRRTGNVRVTATYTLQFADGTGSDDLSQENLVNLNQPNLRSITPLNYDSRHNIVTSIDYRFADGKKYDGPKLFGADIFSNAGMNLTLRGRSGEPYTRQRGPTTDVIIGQSERSTLVGQINGSRLPWNFRADLKADKDFKFGGGTNEDGTKKRESYFNAYVQIQNLFDQANIVEVYSYTGNPDDNGYLSSSAGIDRANAATSPTSFYDLFAVRVNDYDHYSRPRTIRLGLGFNF